MNGVLYYGLSDGNLARFLELLNGLTGLAPDPRGSTWLDTMRSQRNRALDMVDDITMHVARLDNPERNLRFVAHFSSADGGEITFILEDEAADLDLIWIASTSELGTLREDVYIRARSANGSREATSLTGGITHIRNNDIKECLERHYRGLTGHE